MSQFQGYLLLVNTHLAWCLNSVLNVKALVGIFIQEKALVGAFSVIVKTNGSFAAQVIAVPLLTLQPRMPPLSDLVLRHMRLLSLV